MREVEMNQLTKDEAKQFFGALYCGRGGRQAIDRNEFRELAAKFIARCSDETVVGTAALQGLMLNYALGSAENAEKAKDKAILLAHISRRGVAAFIESFPEATIDDIMKAAEEAGFDVEVVGAK